MRNMIYVMAAVCLLVSPAMAQSQFDASGRKIEPADQEPMTLDQILPEVNKSSVISGGKYTTTAKILKRSVRDSQAKAVGEVRDVYVGSGGSVEAVTAVFSRLQLKGTVALDLVGDGITGAPEGYSMGFAAQEIKTIFPELVTRTKENPPSQKGFSAGKLVGADVVSSGGEDVGKLKEILFDAKGEHADLAYLVVNYGPLKNKAVIVPFGVIELQTKRERPVLVIANEDLEVIFKYLTNKMKK